MHIKQVWLKHSSVLDIKIAEESTSVAHWQQISFRKTGPGTFTRTRFAFYSSLLITDLKTRADNSCVCSRLHPRPGSHVQWKTTPSELYTAELVPNVLLARSETRFSRAMKHYTIRLYTAEPVQNVLLARSETRFSRAMKNYTIRFIHSRACPLRVTCQIRDPVLTYNEKLHHQVIHSRACP